jgi:hypothetical protein
MCHRMLHLSKFHNLEDSLDSHNLFRKMTLLDKYKVEVLFNFIIKVLIYRYYKKMNLNMSHNYPNMVYNHNLVG